MPSYIFYHYASAFPSSSLNQHKWKRENRQVTYRHIIIVEKLHQNDALKNHFQSIIFYSAVDIIPPFFFENSEWKENN